MTKFEEIYDVFLSQISDPTFMENDEDDELKYRYLLNSVPRFRKCKQDLSDRDEEQFNVDLTDEEILILGTLMVCEYLSPMIVSLQSLQQFLNSKDFELSSQANHLRSLMAIQKSKKQEVDKLIVDYTYNNGNLSELR